jgi:hypothetical protein
LIKSITIKGFKSLADVTLELGPLNLFVGTNSSGKSNFFDALRVLQGIGLGFTISEILNGKPKGAGGDVWEPIRGGSANSGYRQWVAEEGKSVSMPVSIEVTLGTPGSEVWEGATYSIGFDPRKGWLLHEALSTLLGWFYSSEPVENPPEDPVFRVRYYRGVPGRQPHLSF